MRGRSVRGSSAATLSRSRTPDNLRYSLFLLCFFLSGSAGLAYEVAWSKALGLVFGNTAYALTTVLAVFMAGLAAGSAVLGRRSARTARPLAFYAWLEIAIAVTGLLSLAGIAAVHAVYVAAYPITGSGPALVVLRSVLAAMVLFIPAFLMGGTFPMLVRGLRAYSSALSGRVARLYWVNTAGAVAGTLLSGFVLLPALGIRATLATAAILNLVAGMLAFRISRSSAGTAAARTGHAHAALASRASLSSRLLLLCFALVGATSMAYEIGWTRLLATQLGSSSYAFTLMLATFLAGILLGSAAFEVWSRRWALSQGAFAWTQTLIAVVALAFLLFFSRLPELLPLILRATQQSFAGVLAAQLAISALAMLPTAVLFGINFPLVTFLVAGAEPNGSADSDGPAAGRAYAWNTLGAIVGALLSGFLLLPRLGSFHLLAAAAAVNVALAALLLISNSPRTAAGLLGFAGNAVLLFAIAAVGLSPRFPDRGMAAFNTMLYWNDLDEPLTIRERAHLEDVLYLNDGVNATIAVERSENLLTLLTNGKVDASNRDTATQLLLGHIGALAHSAPRRVLVIGFGSGMTLSALARYPEIQRLDCVEIEPAVIAAAPLLTSLNRNVLQDKRVHIIVDDARNFLATTREPYDLIVSEPSNPWVAGVASLFTQEFYRSAQAHLTRNGIFVQWIHAYSLFPDDLRMVFATFLTTFQNVTLWHGDAPDLLLVAPVPDAATMLKRARTLWNNAGLHEDFRQLGMEQPEGIFGFYILGDAALRRFSAGARFNTDDLTLLEYHAPRALLVPGLADENQGAILLAQDDVLPRGITDETRESVLAASAATSINQEDHDSAERFMRTLGGRPVNLTAAIAAGRLALTRSDLPAARQWFGRARSLDANSIEAAWGLAEVERLEGSTVTAHDKFLRILQRDPANVRVLNSLVDLDIATSRLDEAASLKRRMLVADPHAAADDYAQLAAILLAAGDVQGGEAAAQTCLEHDPYNSQTHFNLAKLFHDEGKWSRARGHLEFLKRHFPQGHAETYLYLYDVYRALRDSGAAAAAVRFGLRLFPQDPDLRKLESQL